MELIKNSKLFKCPNYFISWLNDCNIDPDEKQTKTMVRCLYERIGSPFDSDDESDDESDDSESDGEKSKSNENETNEEEEQSPDTDSSKSDEINEDNMMFFTQTMASLIEAFLRLRLRNFEIAKRNMDWVESRLNHSQFQTSEKLKEYVRSFEFVLNLLKCHNDILRNSMDAQKEVEMSIEDFSDKEKSIVMMARWMLEESLRLENSIPKEQSIRHLIEVSRLDPTNWVWHYLLTNRIRYNRRSNGGGNTKPSEEEILAIVSSAKHAPEGYQRICIAGVCQCLAEIIKWNSYNNRHQNDRGPIIMGHIKFENAEKGVDYIKQRARSLFKQSEDEPDVLISMGCFPEFIRFGDILSTILPPTYRDYKLAHTCMGFSIMCIPHNSKAHHKMGIIELIGFKGMEKAVEYLGNSVEFGIANFPALIDLIKTLLSSVKKYDNKLKETFSCAYENRKIWTERQFLALKFLEGCYYFLKNQIEKAVECWVLLIKNPEPLQKFSNTFDSLAGAAKRHNWSRETTEGLSKENILQKIKSVMDVEKDEIRQLLSRIEEEMKDRPIQRPRGSFDAGDMRRSISEASGPQSYRQQRFAPTDADEDNCWRKKPSAPPGGENPSAQSSYRPPQQRFGATPNQNLSNRNRRDSWKNRTPSPDNWRS